jgi:hypothetical protein
MAKVSGWTAGFAVLIGAALICGSAFAADKPATTVTADQRAAGMKAAPDLAKAAGLPCTVADARMIGSGTGADKVKASYYEVACKEGGGYVLVVKDKVPTPTYFDCLMTGAPGPDGKPGMLACALPANANPAAVLQPLLTQAGSPCTVDKGRYIGSTTDKNLYEASCKDGQGYVLVEPKAGGAPVAQNCLAYASQGGGISCTLTTQAQELSEVDSLAAASGKCAIKDRRYVLTAADGTDYFEVSCSDGKGYMLHADKTGKLAEVVPCATAAYVGGGCTLTDSRQAMTQQTGIYTDLAKKAGFDCTVSKYADFPASNANQEVVEVACSNRPDGGVGVFPTHGAPKVYDCVRALAEGYKCSYTPESAVYPKLTAELKAMGKGSCVVNGARAFGHSAPGDDFIEVSCSDGGPGWVIDIEPNGRTEADGLRNCAQAASLGNGGCQLPSKKS